MSRAAMSVTGALLAAVLAGVSGCAGAGVHQPPTATAATTADAALSTTSPRPPAPPSGASGQHRPDHIVIVVFENTSYRQIVDSDSAGYLTGLANRSALFTNAHTETHPSQPNYLALFSGATQGVTDDHCPVDLGARPNLARQLLDAGYGFTGYSEAMPSAGFLGCGEGRYAAKPNPWVDFANVPAQANQPYTAFPHDYAQLPTVAFVIPDMCNDMHDCSVATGDRWAADHLDDYLRWATGHNSLLVVTFDEDDGSADNHILTLIAGAGVQVATHPERIDHYTLLRTVEDCFGLAPIGAAATAQPLHHLWQ